MNDTWSSSTAQHTTANFAAKGSLACAFAAAAMLGMIAVPRHAHAIDTANPDWPCVQRKVVTLTSSQLWDGPPVEDITDLYSDNDLTKVLNVIMSRRLPMETVEKAIEDYAKSLPAEKRDEKLTTLFAAVVKRTNSVRGKVVKGIEKFQRRQVSRSERLEKEGKKLAELKELAANSKDDKDLKAKVIDAQKTYDWDARVFKERQDNIPLACEIPVIIEQRAFNIGRAIRNHMGS